jgi:hypothetical protein
MREALDLHLEVTSQAADHLVVRYRITNEWDREVYLLNRLYSTQPGGGRTLDPNRVYDWIDGSSLVLAKRLFAVPQSIDVDRPEVPFLTALPPHTAVSEEISLPQPMIPLLPYLPPHRNAERAQRVHCDAIVLELGYLVPRAEHWITRLSVANQPLLASAYGFAIQAQEVVTSAPRPAHCHCLAQPEG